MPEALFRSFLMGGFECSTHINRSGRRLDMIAATRHDEFAEKDYQRLIDLEISTARDGVRWHLIEPEPGNYDLSSLARQAAAAKKTGIQIIWDLFHYGFPDDIDVTTPQFVERFTPFAAAVCEYLVSEIGPELIICPVNEISFFSWAAGRAGIFHPFRQRKAAIIKTHLIDAAVSAISEIRSRFPQVRWIFTEPAIHVVPKNSDRRAAERYRLAQFEALDELHQKGCIDVIGLNYYIHNQWQHPSRRPLRLDDPRYRAPSEIFKEYFDRYGRPVLISETGIEDERRADWLRFVAAEAESAASSGVPLSGLCLYPIVNHPGWEDWRHCHNGLWDYADSSGARESYAPLESAIREVNGKLRRS